MNTKFYGIAKKAGLALKNKRLFLATAESCTGGLLAASVTDVPGSSSYFKYGFVVYSNIAKKEFLGVKDCFLKKFGAVSEEVAEEMARGALRYGHAKISIAITGIAGPTGGSKIKPKGTVCFAIACKKEKPKAITMHFKGNRSAVREQAVEFALKWLISFLFSLT